MLRNQMTRTKKNEYGLKYEDGGVEKDVPVDLEFWKSLSIKAIKSGLWRPLMTIDSLTELPAHPNLRAVLQNISKRLDDSLTEAMAHECLAFALDSKNAHYAYGQGQAGEPFLQLRAIVSYYLGNYEEAAKYAGLLGDVYYANHHSETDWKSGHFNQLAGMAYRECGDTEKACRYFQQYVDTNCSHEVNEHLIALKYLLDNNSLILRDYGLVNRLKWIAEDVVVAGELKNEYSELSARVTEMYEATAQSRGLKNEKSSRDIAAESAVVVAQELFADFIRPQPSKLSADNVQEAMQELTELKEKCKALYDLSMSNRRERTSEENMELDYQFKKSLGEIKTAIDSLDAGFIERMSLKDIHMLIQADDFFHANYPHVADLFYKHANIISSKLRNCDNFLSLAQFKRYNAKTFGDILLFKTTGKERIRLYSMIHPKFNEIKDVPFSGINCLNDRSVLKEATEAVEKMRRLQQSERSKAVPATLFAASRMDASVSTKQMANSALGQKRPEGHDDSWQDYTSTYRP